MSKVQGVDRLQKRLKAISVESRAEIRKALGQSADEIVAVQRQLAPKRSGALARSIVATFGGAAPAFSTFRSSSAAGGDPDLQVTISAGNSEVRYAHLVEFGTAPHPIEPVHAEALGGAGQFGTHVDHPGAAAKPFFYPGYRLLKKRVRGRVTRAVNRAAKKAAGKS
jgi:HK97 gp10 family phage protein